MDLGLNIAASGMVADQVRQDQLASDLANASTPGYKPDIAVQVGFGQLLLANSMTGNTIGSIDTGVEVAKQVTNMNQGTLEPTNQPLDFAISGSGFFAIKTANGVQYTRNGQFTKGPDGLLVNQNGDPVLSQSGSTIPVGSSSSVPSTAVGVFNVPNAQKAGDNNFTGTSTGQATGVATSGSLEQSAVDPIETMIDMTGALQSYQAGQQSIQTISQTMQESASTVGLINGG